jgi:hypothetical protein
VKLFGVVITTRRAIMRERMDNAAHDAQFQLRTLLLDNKHPLRGMIARVARSAAKDYFEEQAEADRAKFEADPAFVEWSRQRREHDLAEAERQQPAGAPPADVAERDRVQLRFGILGLLMEHGVQFTASIADAFEGWTPKEITQALDGLVSDSLVEVKHGVYVAAWRAGLGFPDKKEETRDENPDPQ